MHRLSALENVLLGRMGYLLAWRNSLRRYPRSDRDVAYSLLGRVGMAPTLRRPLPTPGILPSQ